MVAIVNVSEQYKKGLQEYEVRINRQVVCRVAHHYNDGLAKLLFKAAKAVEELELEESCLHYLKAQL